MAERTIATVLKTVVGATSPGVRIPLPPPKFTFCEIVRNSLGAKRLGMVFFRNFEDIFEIQKQSAVGNYAKSITHKVILIDGEMLTQLMIENNIGVSKVISYDIKKIDSDYFVEE